MMIDLPTNIRPRWGRNPRIHLWGASASACDARGSSRDTPDFTSEEFQLQPTAHQEVPEIPQTSRLGMPPLESGGTHRRQSVDVSIQPTARAATHPNPTEGSLWMFQSSLHQRAAAPPNSAQGCLLGQRERSANFRWQIQPRPI
jgi:hypothetical protein